MAYVQAQLAIVTPGNMATALQYQLMASVTGPLLTALQQAGLSATKIELDSLDIEQVCDTDGVEQNHPDHVCEHHPSSCGSFSCHHLVLFWSARVQTHCRACSHAALH